MATLNGQCLLRPVTLETHWLPLSCSKILLGKKERGEKILSSFRRTSHCFLGRIKMHKGKKEAALLRVSYWLWVILTPQKILKQLAANLSTECTSIQYLAPALRRYPPSPNAHTPFQVFPPSLWWLSEPTGLEKAGFVGREKWLVPRTTQAPGPLGEQQIGLQKETAQLMSLGSNAEPKAWG